MLWESDGSPRQKETDVLIPVVSVLMTIAMVAAGGVWLIGKLRQQTDAVRTEEANLQTTGNCE